SVAAPAVDDGAFEETLFIANILLALAVAVRVRLVPGPGMADDGLELGEARLPPELGAGAFGSGHQPCRVAGPAIRRAPGDRAAGDLFRGPDHLEHRAAVAVAEVEGVAALALPQPRQRQIVRLAEIVDVDVVAHA